ncbi:phage protein NinX family protein [Burkholderia stabilis]|uniref:phage protein NinX family protein n=1 Tax=Burkholderia stabilis TaxID=95485 RepID=UPI001F4B7E5E|nr:phage protein NinX family protein [Burkholderia stabilis]
MKSNIEGEVLESDDFVTHRKAWRDALLIVRNNGWLVGLDDGPLNWDTCIQAFDEAFALYALGSIPDAFTSNHEAWRLALTLAQDFAKVQGLDVDDEAYWEHEIRAFDRAFESVGIRLAELPEDEPAIESYCQQVCGGGECGAGAVCQHGIDPTTELPVASFDAKLPQATLVSSEHGFDDYDVTGIPTVHRVAIGQGIRKGESFNVYCDEGRKIGSVWQGTLEKSLEDLSVRFAAEAAEEWNLPEIQAATIAVKVQDLVGVRLDWAVAKALGCELVSAHDNFRRIAKGAWSEEKITEQLGKMTNEQVIINPMSGNAEPLPAFSTGWLSAGPIIERERISTNYDASGRWSQGWRAFSNRAPIMLGETLLVAAMRSYVASKLGEEVAVPANLLA